jgi:hypothetical protein
VRALAYVVIGVALARCIEAHDGVQIRLELRSALFGAREAFARDEEEPEGAADEPAEPQVTR